MKLYSRKFYILTFYSSWGSYFYEAIFKLTFTMKTSQRVTKYKVRCNYRDAIYRVFFFKEEKEE